MAVFPVSIAGKQYSADFQTLSEFAKGWRTVLTNGHGSSAVCYCRPFEDGHRKLSVKYVKANDNYHLARFSGTDEQHDELCCFGRVYPSRDVTEICTEETLSAVRKTESGVAVTFHLGISTGKATQLSSAKQTSSTPRKKRSTLELKGLLELVWEQSGLNVWHPVFAGKRNYMTALHRIATQSKNISVNGIPLSTVLLLQTTEKNEASNGRNADVTNNAIQNKQKLFVIAKLARFNSEKYTPYPRNIPVVGYFGMPWVSVSPELWQRTEVACESAYRDWVAGTDVIAIALIEPNTSTSGEAIEIALMSVTDKLLPSSN